MKLKVTRNDISRLFQGLDSVSHIRHLRFSYAVTKNLRFLREELETLQKVVDIPEEAKPYDNKRLELAKQYATKDADGNPVKINSGRSYDFTSANYADFEKALEKVQGQKDFKDSYSAFKQHNEKVKEFMEETIEINYHIIKYEDLPLDLSAAQLDMIFEFVSEEEEVKKGK